MIFVEALREEVASWLLNDQTDGGGGGFVGCVFTLAADIACHVATFASRGALLRDPYLATDALPALAWERGIQRYETETTYQHAERCANAWDTYTLPGRPAIKEQMGFYGFGDNVEIYDAYQWPAEPPVGPKSQFWVVVPAGDHPFAERIIGAGAAIGDDEFIGIEGITATQIGSIVALVMKWKPVQWVCREVRFDIGGGLYAAIEVQPYP
jgi:hypothetical protein